jgi:hypothetical protein
MSPQTLSVRQKVNLALLLITNAFAATRRDIGSGLQEILGGAEEVSHPKILNFGM